MVRINDEFEATVEVRTVVHLYRDGTLIRTPDGGAAEYTSVEEAAYVARNWHAYGGKAPIDMTDDELHERIGQLSWLDRGRRLLAR
jgi:hypothetical protein